MEILWMMPMPKMSAENHATPPTELSSTSPRRKAREKWLQYNKPISRTSSLVLGCALWAIFFGLWELADAKQWVNPLFMPAPHKVLVTLYSMFAHQGFLADVVSSVSRIVASFALACVVAIPLGVLMGCFRPISAFFNPFVSAWRYLPAPAFIPLLLMWFGAGEGSKLALLFVGVIFFLVTLIMDHTRAVRAELIETAMTLGASRTQILRTIVLPAVAPKILISMRQMLAVSWTYLVIAEIIAATTGIGAVMMRGQRFLKVDEIMAGILVIGLLGLAFDFLFRLAHKKLFPYVPAEEA
jgi:NitT/TauT family transport system permease protein